ncbi:outer membrane beta-barrel protein [Pelagicoccus sp. SDUM812002]|uniref:outer membrane beta-barrel protein n=1 Tax=Pelagicoccus sp. SDUM812002 TaxID=3041266 RepID=UPI0028108B6F|nr:outer membrane beta-barrel protein [Pelagicoccus sp. SDUM812002]MDQ8187128.1 outer membrane beta-barrel protein [Pelagicoccus sp. SDUM812002]
MNSRKFTVLSTAVLLMLTPNLKAEGEWSFSIKGGVANAVSGDVHRGPDFDGSILLALDPGSLPVEVDAKSFDDVYGGFMELGFEAAYRRNENLSFFMGLSQLQSDEGILRVGTVGDDLPLNGRFSDYDDIGIYGGVRYHFSSESNWQPFVSAQLGIKDVDEITASFSVPGVTFVDPYQEALTNAPFYDGGTVFSYGVGVGLEYRISDSGTLSLETGYYSQEAMDDDDSVLDVLALGALNDEGDLDYLPITLRYTFNF